jgi:glutathione peroxidase
VAYVQAQFARPCHARLLSPGSTSRLECIGAGGNVVGLPVIEPLVPTAIEQIPLRTIDGSDSSLGAYAGKVRLVVNVASRCGFTPQYTALEALYEKYRDRGFEVLAFPANEFGSQEPGTDAEIKEFCSTTYDVRFPVFSKILVKGAGQHPLYAALIDARPAARVLPGSDFRAKLMGYGIPIGEPNEILWNFEKFLVDRVGNVVDRFGPDVLPDAELVVSAIERELGR